MAYYTERITTTVKVASLIGAHLPVFQPVGSSRDDIVVLAASENLPVLGLMTATGASVGNAYAVALAGEAKAIAAASLGAGAQVGVASTNGALGPLAYAGPTHVASGGSIQPRFIVGKAKRAAAAGDIFTVLLDPRQIL